MDKKHKGAHNELLATVWLLKQGYEVFRNVSAHGCVDIVATKDGEVTLFDVKQSSIRADGTSAVQLSQEQIELGVHLLFVGSDGDCQIFSAARVSYGEFSCAGCGVSFARKKRLQRFCSSKCRSDLYNEKVRVALAASRMNGFAMEKRS